MKMNSQTYQSPINITSSPSTFPNRNDLALFVGLCEDSAPVNLDNLPAFLSAKYRDIFSPTSDIVDIDGHKINTGNAPAVKSPPYKLSAAEHAFEH